MTAVKPAGRLVLRTRPTPLSIVVGLFVALAMWEGGAQLMAATTAQGDRVMPSLVTAATTGLTGLSDYWAGGFGFDATSSGGAQSVGAAVLVLVVNAGITLMRVFVGLAFSLVCGIGLGLLISAVRPVRLSVGILAETLRMLPALAMAPLFILWFGATDLAAMAFILFSVTFIMLVGTTVAVTNLPSQVLEYPRTLGVRGLNLWLRVVVPAVLPELRGTIIFSALVAWTSVLAAEMYGLPSGLGWILSETLRFSLIDRMLVVAVVFSALALVTMKGIGALVSYLTRWA